MPSIHRSEFGYTKNDEPIYSFKLMNENGIVIQCLNYGACLSQFLHSNHTGQQDDIVLGFDSVSEYESIANQNFGGTIGRVAGRIKNGQFTLDNQLYKLCKNWRGHHLHGGSFRPLDRVIWDAEDVSDEETARIKFTYFSPDGEEGYPGNVSIQIYYSLDKQNSLTIEFCAQTDQKTPINLTNHSYWNLKGAGNGTILDHTLEINADRILACDHDMIPTGAIEELAPGDPLDFSKPKEIGICFENIMLQYPQHSGIDHTYVLNHNSVKLSEKRSKRSLRIDTDFPCVQVYSGNYLHGQIGKNKSIYQPYGGIALECQMYPDSVNQGRFPSCIISPQEQFEHYIRFSVSSEI